MEINISSAGGMEMIGEPTAGTHTFAVHFEDQMVYENFLGHDVHLARLTPETDVEAVIAWMNWAAPAGLQTPAPCDPAHASPPWPVP